MGLDGGTKISRSDVLRGASWRLARADGSRSTRGGAVSTSTLLKEEAADAQAIREAALSCCSLSGAALRSPVVCDDVGNLYNRADCMEYIIGRTLGQFSDVQAKRRFDNVQRVSESKYAHLKKASSVFPVILGEQAPSAASLQVATGPVQLTEAALAAHTVGGSAGEAARKGTLGGDARAAPDTSQRGDASKSLPLHMSCPVMDLPFRTNRCAALRPCGHIVSLQGLRMAQGSSAASANHKVEDLEGSANCPICDAPCDLYWDAIELCPGPKELAALREKLPRRRKRRRLTADSSLRKRLKGAEQPILALPSA